MAQNLKSGYHRIKVVKITEAEISSIGVINISVDGYFAKRLTPTPKKLKIVAYGDSITAGCCNQKATGAPDGGLIPREANPQNGMQTYATYSAQDLNADIMVMAKTGIGIYNTYGNKELTMLNYFEKTFCASRNYINGSADNPIYDFSESPDITIINLGTNDIWSGESATTVVEKYKILVDKILQKNKDTKIIICAGMMILDISAPLQNFVKDMNKTNKNIYFQQFSKCKNGHPSKAEHRAYANILTNKIKSIMK